MKSRTAIAVAVIAATFMLTGMPTRRLGTNQIRGRQAGQQHGNRP